MPAPREPRPAPFAAVLQHPGSAPGGPVWVDVGSPPGTDVGSPPGTDVWHIVLDVEPETAGPFGALLDAEERHRAHSLRDRQAAQRFTVAHGAVRAVLGHYLGAAGGTLHWARGPNGKPYFDGPWRRWQWSLSRSGGHALLAVRLHDPVGVDLEQIRDDVRATALAARFMPADEAAEVLGQPDDAARNLAYHRLLSRKEACVKAGGGRLLDGLRLGVLVPGIVEGSGAFAGQRWTLRDLPAPPGFVATLATVGDRPQRLRMFEWDWRAYPSIMDEGGPPATPPPGTGSGRPPGSPADRPSGGPPGSRAGGSCGFSAGGSSGFPPGALADRPPGSSPGVPPGAGVGGAVSSPGSGAGGSPGRPPRGGLVAEAVRGST